MFKPGFLNILLYIFCKYLVFVLITVFIHYEPRYSLRNFATESVLFFLVLLIPMPLINAVFLSGPLYLSFKLRPFIRFVLLGAILMAEYIIFCYLGSQKMVSGFGILNSGVSIGLYLLFFTETFTSIKCKGLSFSQDEDYLEHRRK
ncbi:hypothetical protein SAMN05444266_103170 [Chitinophaga jiangningensis]|uniref:Uncharacterized protein n=1 Tax=Chitinophaga jiangningensis TaxID=1419482 RepID=A0A1M7A8H5_9BACT|nr:hypothetical protein SAMN05444266_103170 [Chitinophaga jiangningensis]